MAAAKAIVTPLPSLCQLRSEGGPFLSVSGTKTSTEGSMCV